MRKNENEGVGGAEWTRLIGAYLNERAAAGISPSTLYRQRRVLRVFEWFLAEHHVTQPGAILRKHLEAWLDFLRDEYEIRTGRRKGLRLSATNVYGWFASTVIFLRHLTRAGEFLVDPCTGLEMPRYPRSRRRFIPTVEEVTRFLEAIPPRGRLGLRDRALFELLYSTGLRSGEASHLDVYDLDLVTRTVRVREGKGGQDRAVPVGDTACTYLRRYLSWVRPTLWTPTAGDALFVTKRGRRMMAFGIACQCVHWRAVANLPHLTTHALRHAAATHMLIGGADVRHVQAFLGHRAITSTALYTHLLPLDLQRTHRKSHPRG